MPKQASKKSRRGHETAKRERDMISASRRSSKSGREERFAGENEESPRPSRSSRSQYDESDRCPYCGAPGGRSFKDYNDEEYGDSYRSSSRGWRPGRDERNEAGRFMSKDDYENGGYRRDRYAGSRRGYGGEEGRSRRRAVE